jgi:release factor glutamine methyltransferase
MRFVKTHFAEGPDGPFDFVVSNPPYVRGDAIPELTVEVRDHDPRVALYGGSDGLAAYRLIVPRIRMLLAKHGVLAFEVGFDQAESVADLCRRAGFGHVTIRRDLSGHARVVMARETLPADNS